MDQSDSLESIAESLRALAAVAPKVGEAYTFLLESMPQFLKLLDQAQAAAAAEGFGDHGEAMGLMRDLVQLHEDLAKAGLPASHSSAIVDRAREWLQRRGG